MNVAIAAVALLHCTAAMDESSHYELSAPAQKESPAEFRYVTDDGLDLRAQLRVQEWSADENRAFRLVADDGNMRITLAGALAKEGFPASLKVEFSLEHAEPLDLDARCTFR